MIEAVATRQAVAVTLLALLMAAGSLAAVNSYSEADKDETWMAPLQQQYGWSTNELKNKIQQGDVTTFELGSPNYQILNSEDEPEFITEDHPHYREILERLTNAANGTDVIDLSKPRSSDTEEPQTTTENCEKLRKRSFEEASEKIDGQQEVEALPLDEKSRHPRAQVYAGAKPFQTEIANLS